MSDLVERVARALARQAYSAGGMERITDPYTPDAEYWDGQARAAIAVLRPALRAAALEEAARVADSACIPMCEGSADLIAAAIRAMITKEDT